MNLKVKKGIIRMGIITAIIVIIAIPVIAIPVSHGTAPAINYLTIYFDNLPAPPSGQHYYTYNQWWAFNQTWKGIGYKNISLTYVGDNQYQEVWGLYVNTTLMVVGELYVGTSNLTAVPLTSEVPSFSSGNFSINYNQTLVIYYTPASVIHPVHIAVNTQNIPSGLNYTATFRNTVNGSVYVFTGTSGVQGNITLPSGFYYVSALSSDGNWEVKGNFTASSNGTLTLSFTQITLPVWQSEVSSFLYANFGITFYDLMIGVLLATGMVLFLIMNRIGFGIRINFLPVLALAVIGYTFGVAPLWFPVVMAFVYVVIIYYARSDAGIAEGDISE